MPYLIDTNVLIMMRDNDAAIIQRISALPDTTYMSMISLIELENGVVKEDAVRAQRRKRIDEILRSIRALAFEEDSAAAYRAIVEARGYSRRKMLDRMIAAQAIVMEATLVTRNGPDFADVPGLSLEAW